MGLVLATEEFINIDEIGRHCIYCGFAQLVSWRRELRDGRDGNIHKREQFRGITKTRGCARGGLGGYSPPSERNLHV